LSRPIQEFSPVEKLTMDEFKKYLQAISELNTIASKIEEWCNKNIWSVVGGSQTGEAKIPFHKWPEEIRKIVVSGLKVERYKRSYYTTNAYALFVKDFLGVELENPAALVEKLSFGEDISDVDIVFGRTWFMVFVDQVFRITDFILKSASEFGVKVEPPRIVEKPIHELVEDFIQKAYEVAVGVNEFATSVWGLRKIISSYMKKVYGNVPQQILDVLGFKKLLKAKHVELWGFEDYFTRSAVYCIYRSPYSIVNNVPAPLGFFGGLSYVSDVAKREKILAEIRQLHSLATLGGAICSLSQAVWSYTRRLNDVLKKWFVEYVNLETEYIRKAWERLGVLGWGVPEYLRLSQEHHNVASEYTYFREGLAYDENGIVEHMIFREGSEDCKCGYKKESQVALVARILYDLAPAMLLGVSDVTLELRLYGRFYDNLCGDMRYGSIDPSSYEDVRALVVFFRR